MLGSILGSPYSGKLPFFARFRRDEEHIKGYLEFTARRLQIIAFLEEWIRV